MARRPPSRSRATLKGRNVFGCLELVPRVIDTVGNRDAPSASAIYVNGNRNI